jgi:hypothetical protein
VRRMHFKVYFIVHYRKIFVGNRVPSTDFASRQLQTASELYAAIDEFKSDQLFNLPAPDPWISFSIGSVSLIVVREPLND